VAAAAVPAVPERVRVAEVSDAAVDVARLTELVAAPGVGAVVTFVGAVRDHDTPGRGAVRLLDYEAHPQAGEVMHAVCRQVADSHPKCTLAAIHRVGPLTVGDVALAVAVAAAHRGPAFAAAEDLVEQIKSRLPVWKHQVFADGTDEWVGLGEAVPFPG
jgi:molybdopterin synthase catalytic subunit